RLSNVLLPEPDGPISAVSSPRPSRRSISRSTVLSSAVPGLKVLLMPCRRSTSSDITDRHGRVITGGAAGRDCRGQHTGQSSDQHRHRYQRRLHRYPEQPRPEDVEYLHQSPADGTANAGTDQPEQPALQQEHPQDLPPWTAHRPQDADLPGALHDADRQHTGDTEGHGDADKYPDHLSGHALGGQGIEQLAVGLHPAFGLQPG